MSLVTGVGDVDNTCNSVFCVKLILHCFFSFFRDGCVCVKYPYTYVGSDYIFTPPYLHIYAVHKVCVFLYALYKFSVCM